MLSLSLILIFLFGIFIIFGFYTYRDEKALNPSFLILTDPFYLIFHIMSYLLAEKPFILALMFLTILILIAEVSK